LQQVVLQLFGCWEQFISSHAQHSPARRHWQQQSLAGGNANIGQLIADATATVFALAVYTNRYQPVSAVLHPHMRTHLYQ
jgi:hypothetical protein